jgi:esterase/lipase superfamily enzyme
MFLVAAPCCCRDQGPQQKHGLGGSRVARCIFAGAHVIVPHVQSVVTASRRRVLRGLASASVLALGGCAGLASGGPRFDASAIALDPTLLLATTRKPVDGGRTKPWYGPERSSSMTVARVKLIPPDDGRFSLASVGLVDWQIDKIEPAGQIGDLIPSTAGGHDVLLYVHGYNTTFETAVLDAARLSDGIKFVGDTMAFSWPSRASLLDYGYDRESAMWSRDSLQQVLDGLIANQVVGHVHIVAHSIGTMLTM